MKNILILSNFESYSKNAIDYTLQLCRGQACHFNFLNIVKVWSYTSDDLMAAKPQQAIYDSILSDSKTQLQHLVSDLRSRYKEENYLFSALTDYDVFTDAIQQAVENYHIDYIVMGADGTSNLIERIFGSHSTRVLRNVACPVLIVPKGYRYEKTSKVLLVLDQSNVYNSGMAQKLVDLFPNDKLEVSVLRLSQNDPIHQQEELAAIARDFDQKDIPYFKMPEAEVQKGSLLKTVDAVTHAQFNVVLTQPQSLLHRLVASSGVSDIILNIERPTLFLKH
ncbi:MAG: universal stress protein [Dokdonia sp.]|jgi:nucleotide-binding universal stress UspA family protein|nr:hypothetical protein [Cytophagaceae bacterium]